MRLEEMEPYVRFARYHEITRGEVILPWYPYDARLFYTVEGEGEILCQNRVYPMPVGSLLLIAQGIPYTNRVGAGEKVRYLVLNFDYTLPAEWDRGILSPQHKAQFQVSELRAKPVFPACPALEGALYIPGKTAAEPYLRRIKTEFCQGILYAQTQMSALLKIVILDAVRTVTLPHTAKNAQIQSVQDLLSYLQTHYAEPMTNFRLGKQFGFHPNYVSALIKRATGMPFHAYLAQIRILQAVQLLENTDLSVTEIGQRVGFDDLSYFIKCFRRQMGNPPSAYRKLCKA